MPDMRFCPFCGASISRPGRFCGGCGQALQSDAAPPTPSSAPVTGPTGSGTASRPDDATPPAPYTLSKEPTAVDPPQWIGPQAATAPVVWSPQPQAPFPHTPPGQPVPWNSTPPSPWAGGAADGTPVVAPWSGTRFGQQIEQRLARSGLSGQRLLAGDWAGAAMAAGAGIGAMLVVTALLVFLAAAGTGVPVGNLVGATAMGIALAVGGSLDVSAGLGGTGIAAASSSFTGTPLVLTVIGFGLLAAVFLSRLRTQRVVDPVDVALQAVRVWIVLLGLLVVVCLVGRIQIGGGASSSGLSAVASVSLTTEFVATLFFGTCWLWFTLLVAVAWRMPGVLPARLARWRDAAGPATVGVVVAMVLAWVLTLVIIVAVSSLAAGSTPTPVSGYVAGATLPALGVLMLFGPGVLLALSGFGLGVPVTLNLGLGGSGTSALGQLGSGGSLSLLDATDLDARFWLLPVIIGAALIVGGMIAALHAPTPQHAQRTSWRLGVALAVTLFLIAVNTAVSTSGAALGLVSGSAGFHLDYLLTIVLGLVWGTLAGWLGGVLAPKLPTQVITDVRGRIDRVAARRRPGPYGRPPVPGADGVQY